MSLRSNTGRLAVLVSAAVLVPAFSPCQEVEPAVPTIFVAGPAALDVLRAARDAIRKLQEPGCQRLLDDFTAREGRPLRETLGNSTPEAYFVGLVLRNGEIPVGSGHCASPGAAAFTTNGAAVFVCGTSFQSSAGAPARTPSFTRCSTPSVCARTRRARPRSAGGWPCAAAAKRQIPRPPTRPERREMACVDPTEGGL